MARARTALLAISGKKEDSDKKNTSHAYSQYFRRYELMIEL
jgi:hypothetical protein